MTVVPLPRHDRRADADPRGPLLGTAQVAGAYRCPDGAVRRFTGSYRLERLVWQFGQLAASGVFSGQVLVAGDSGAGVASRRQTTAAEVVDSDGLARLRVGPVDVRLCGLTVAVDEFTVVAPLRLVSGLADGTAGTDAGGAPAL